MHNRMRICAAAGATATAATKKSGARKKIRYARRAAVAVAARVCRSPQWGNERRRNRGKKKKGGREGGVQ